MVLLSSLKDHGATVKWIFGFPPVLLIPIHDGILKSEFEVHAIFELIQNRCRVHKTGTSQVLSFTGTGTSML